jgi:hypothetical protein
VDASSCTNQTKTWAGWIKRAKIRRERGDGPTIELVLVVLDDDSVVMMMMAKMRKTTHVDVFQTPIFYLLTVDDFDDDAAACVFESIDTTMTFVEQSRKLGFLPH